MIGITVYTQDTVPVGTALNPNDVLIRMNYVYSNQAGSVDLNFATDNTP